MRMEKDAKIRQLEHEKEVQRDAYEKRINELDIIIKSKILSFVIENFRTITNNPLITINYH